MKDILIASFDMEVGGVERSLISMLNAFDYSKYNVNLQLYSHTGQFMELINENVNLLIEDEYYKTMRQSIKDIFRSRKYNIGISRLVARIKAKYVGKTKKIYDSGYIQMQYIWKFTNKFLPKSKKEYDVAISYLWPHDNIAYNVKSKIKIAWIHTDYSTIVVDGSIDLKIWDMYDYIISVSEECKKSFLSVYPELEKKVTVIENIASPDFVRSMSNEYVDDKFDSDKFNIVSVGRLCDAKGFDNAIKALRILHDRGFNNIKWYIVGYGGEEELLKSLIKENSLEDSFILLGKKTNPYPYIKVCDLYVQPSRYEGKAVTVTEAQILGKPVMITNYATAKSQVNNGYDGYITELSVEGIANGIEMLYKNEKIRSELSKNCNISNYNNSYELNKLYEIMKD